MDINILRGLATLLVTVAFLSVCFWAYSGRKLKDFEEAAALPFVDDIEVENDHLDDHDVIVDETNNEKYLWYV